MSTSDGGYIQQVYEYYTSCYGSTLRIASADLVTLGDKQYGTVPVVPPSGNTVKSVFFTNLETCNVKFPGSTLVDLPDGGRASASTIKPASASYPLWWDGFDTIWDVLDFYADEGLSITLGTNIRYDDEL
jgi:hypothetical protein